MTDWQDKPFKISVKEGQRLSFCACGFSKTPPYCDSSHKTMNLNIKPYEIQFEKDESIFTCGCRYSHSRPFCDMTHKTLKDKEVFMTANNVGKRSSSFCESCIPLSIEFVPSMRGYCEECSKKKFLMTIYNFNDEIDQEYYHDCGGEG